MIQIHYKNLLKAHDSFDIFWKTILERLSISDPPFFSTIKDDCLYISENQGIHLKTNHPGEVVDFCHKEWKIPYPFQNWKDIKKESTRIFLLRKYTEKHTTTEIDANLLFIKLQILLNEKMIHSDDIKLEHGEIASINAYFS